jgi:hypothetical protein
LNLHGRERDKSVNSLNGKLDRLRLGLWPEGDDGNGHSYDEDDGITYWKGKRIIPVEEWKRIAGYTDLYDVLSPEEQEELEECWKFKCGDLEQDRKDKLRMGEIIDKAAPKIKREINPEALEYFPEANPNKGHIVFPFESLDPDLDPNPDPDSHSRYYCPKAPDLYVAWARDYQELFKFNGFRPHEYEPPAF